MTSYRINYLGLNVQIELITLFLITGISSAMVQLHRFSYKR